MEYLLWSLCCGSVAVESCLEIVVAEYSCLKLCRGIFVVEFVLWNLCCGISGVESIAAEYVL